MDRFAEIANMGSDDKKACLKGYTPEPLEVQWMNKSHQAIQVLETMSYEERLEKFYEDIKELKGRMAPYLRNLVSEADYKRECVELKSFDFRYETEEDRKDIGHVLKGTGEFESVELPDYRGPVGRWTAYYRKEIEWPVELKEDQCLYLSFRAVDYKAAVYLNGRYVGSHEGFFAPFEFDVTPYYRTEGKNTLVVAVENDYPTLAHDHGNGRMDGDKIYAATGYGYDDPQKGWHHCPPGAGICDRVYLEVRNQLSISDIFVRPDLDADEVEVWVEVMSSIVDNTPFKMNGLIEGKNFEGAELVPVTFEPQPAGPGVNYYKARVPMESYRLWSTEMPYLYNIRVNLYRNDSLVDSLDEHFGMRKFHMDTEADVKGTLYLNDQPVILRGANTMGHMQQCVYKGDMEQLVEDILIAKYANMNFYRLTQRPVQREIYDYCDALGMMLQTDLPLFGWLRRNKVVEAVKQAGEMEKHIRSHPSSIMVTYINEPFPEAWGYNRGHRSLYRDEMESFFRMATENVHLYNPDRVVKNVDGDYDPPTENSLSDFHCYNLWYTNHCLSIGKLHKGCLPPTKEGWKMGCGEYGIEALDPAEIIMEDYPKEWAPVTLNEPWNPDKIIGSQMFTMHGDWFEEQSNLEDWVRVSQCHQAEGIALMNDALRRNTDRVITSAVHLLIDAWPSGWMKTLVDYRRKPKRGYFSFKDTMVPLRVNLRTDRWMIYEDDLLEMECYALNDTSDTITDYKVHVSVMNDQGLSIDKYECDVDALPCSGSYIGSVKCALPTATSDYYEVTVVASLLNQDHHIVNQEMKKVKVVKKYEAPFCLEQLEAEDQLLFINNSRDFYDHQEMIMASVRQGKNLMIDMNAIESIEVLGQTYEAKTIGGVGADGVEGKGLTYVVANRSHPLIKGPKDWDYGFMYDGQADMIGFVCENFISGEVDNHLLYTYETPSFGQATKETKKQLAILSEKGYGQGRIFFSTVRLEALMGKNPLLDDVFRRMTYADDQVED